MQKNGRGMQKNDRGMQKNEAVCKNSDPLIINKCSCYLLVGLHFCFTEACLACLLWINGLIHHKNYIITALGKGCHTSLNNNKLLSRS